MKRKVIKLLSLFLIISNFTVFAQSDDDRDKGAFEDRIKIGFSKFDNKASAVQKTYGGYNSIKFDLDAFTTMITTALVKTRRFEVVERQDLDKLLDEQGITQAGIINSETGAISGKIRGVDF